MVNAGLDEFARRAERLRLDLDDGILFVTIDNAARHNAFDDQQHDEVIELWGIADREPAVRVVHVTGAGPSFSVGGDVAMIGTSIADFPSVERMQRHATGLARGMIDCGKPIVCAVNGRAAGAGLALALLADVSIVAEQAVISDGHARLGLVAGDHAALLWPLLCGLNRAKHLLLLSERVTGADAASIGLVSMAVPAEELLQQSTAVAKRLAASSAAALRWTKHTLNHWLRANWAIFDSSLAYEMLTFLGPDVAEGHVALSEHRQPDFQHPSPSEPSGVTLMDFAISTPTTRHWEPATSLPKERQSSVAAKSRLEILNDDQPYVQITETVANTLIPRHSHSTAEVIAVLSGDLVIGGKACAAGSVLVVPPDAEYDVQVGLRGATFAVVREHHGRLRESGRPS